MIVDIITIFPATVEAYLREGLFGKAREAGVLTVRVHDLRDHTTDKHRTVDDAPFGGTGGMVMKVEPIAAALEALPDRDTLKPHVILPTPAGALFTQKTAERWAAMPRLAFVCGRYKGVDQRVSDLFVDEEASLGDFVLSGGELAALAMLEATARLLPSFHGNPDAAADDSVQGGILEAPLYTRPPEFRGSRVPETLISGNHAAIKKWRRAEALRRTLARRPDLLDTAELSQEDLRVLRELKGERGA